MRTLLGQLKLMGRFLWDPEGVVGLSAHREVPPALLHPFTLVFILGVMAALYTKDIAHLTCWTPRFFGPPKMGLLLLGYGLLVLCADRVQQGRLGLLLWGSLTLSLLGSLPMTLLALGVLLPYAFVVQRACSPWFKHLLVLLLLGGVMALYNFHLAPGVVFSPLWGPAGLMFAFFLPLRLIWYHFQATREGYAGVTYREIFLYFFTAPAPIILPYMFALPRREEMAALKRPEDHTRAQGTLYLFAGATFAVAYQSLDRLVLLLTEIPGMRFLLLPWGYPFEPVFWALSSAYIITGMYNRLGAKVTLAFRSPLKSPSVLEWWRRWNVHFRDVLVDLFFYPLVMGRRKHPYLRIWLGVFGVFILGSTVLHWGVKHYYMNSAFVPYWSILVENGVMCIGVGILLHLEKYRLRKRIALRRAARREGRTLPPQKESPLVLRVLAYPLTYAVVFVSVVGGYAMNLVMEGTYVDRPTALVRYAQQLERSGERARARRYREYAIAEFQERLHGHDDLSSPWRIKERHGAMKLLVLLAQRGDHDALWPLVKKLSWPRTLLSPLQRQSGYRKLHERIHYELTRFKGLRGAERLLTGGGI